MIIHEKGPGKILSRKGEKSNVQKPFVGLINVPCSVHPNPWNCGKSNINKESQGKGDAYNIVIYIWFCVTVSTY